MAMSHGGWTILVITALCACSSGVPAESVDPVTTNVTSIDAGAASPPVTADAGGARLDGGVTNDAAVSPDAAPVDASVVDAEPEPLPLSRRIRGWYCYRATIEHRNKPPRKSSRCFRMEGTCKNSRMVSRKDGHKVTRCRRTDGAFCMRVLNRLTENEHNICTATSEHCETTYANMRETPYEYTLLKPCEARP